MAPNQGGKGPNTRGLGLGYNSAAPPCDRWKFRKAEFTEVDQGFEVASRESSRLESLDFHLWGARLVRFQSLIQSSISIHIYYISCIHILWLSIYPCSSFGPNGSCFNITHINTPITWHLDYCCEVHDLNQIPKPQTWCNTSGLDGDVEGQLSQWHPRLGTLHDGNT